MSWKKYSKKWPEEIKKANKGLQSDLDRGIFIYLLTEGKKSFNRIKSELDIGSNKLSYHLKKLVNTGLVTNKLSHRKDEECYSYYEVSDFGKKYADNVLKAVRGMYLHGREKISNGSSTTYDTNGKADSSTSLNTSPPLIEIQGEGEEKKYLGSSTIQLQTKKSKIEGSA